MSEKLKIEYLGDWGKKIEVVEDTTHITQCNENASDPDARNGAHVTDNYRGTQAKVGTYFDANGKLVDIKFGKR